MVSLTITLATLCAESKYYVLCLQEMHRDETSICPRIPGMNLIIKVPNTLYRSAIFARPGLVIDSAAFNYTSNIKILIIETKKCTITSIYKTPNADFTFEKPSNFENSLTKIVVGDFLPGDTQKLIKTAKRFKNGLKLKYLI